MNMTCSTRLKLILVFFSLSEYLAPWRVNSSLTNDEMRCLLSQLFIALLFLAVQTSSSTMKVFVVQFSSSTLEDTLKIKMRASQAPSSPMDYPQGGDGDAGVLVSAAEEYLRAHCPQHLDIEYFEFYNSKLEQYEILLPSAYLDEGVRLFPVLATIKGGDEEEQLRIEGRAFDTSEGLFIGSRALIIEEQVNRSEGTGLNTWDGSVVLAKYLEKHPQLVHYRRVLEVGSGTGVSGLAASFLGASLSVLTDLDYTLQNLRTNVLLNYPALVLDDEEGGSISRGADGRDSRDGRPLVRALDWTDPSTYLQPSDCQHNQHLDLTPDLSPQNEMTSRAAAGTSSVAAGTSSAAAGAGSCANGGGMVPEGGDVWDVILGADVVWLEQLVEPLATALRAHCSPATVILLAHQKRSEHTDSALFSYLREFFLVNKVDTHELNPEFSSPKINIFECRLKN